MRLRLTFALCLIAFLPPALTHAQMQPTRNVDPLNKAAYFDPAYMGTPLVSSVDLVIPGMDHSRGSNWSVTFSVLIGANGRVKDAATGTNNEPYTWAARNALMRWTWKPQQVNGVPVSIAPTDSSFQMVA
jgi:hypothetical protein